VAESDPQQAFTLYQDTRASRVRSATEQSAKRGDRYLGEPNKDSLKGDDAESRYGYNAVTDPLGR